MNSALGGSALSTIDLVERLRSRYGIESSAICHIGGRNCDFERLREVVKGELIVRPLYWWNKKTRAKYWKRPLIELKQLWRTGMRLSSIRDTVAAVKRFDANLVHSNTILTWEGAATAVTLKMPHVWHVRELIGHNEAYQFFGVGEPRRFGRCVSEHASMVVANSERTRRCIQHWLPAERMALVFNGVEIDRYRVRDIRPRRQPLVVGMVGSLQSSWKRHDWFVEAAGQVDTSLPIEFRLYGFDPSEGGFRLGHSYVEALRRRINEFGLGERVRFMGYTGHEPVEDLDIMLHTSPKESFGRVIVEAMACGLPVIGVNDGGVGEIVIHGETGVLVEPGDVAGLARAVERLACGPELRQSYGLAGRRRAESCFSLDACADGIAEVYRRAMKSPVG